MDAIDFQKLVRHVDSIASYTRESSRLLTMLLSAGLLTISEHELISSTRPEYAKFVHLCCTLTRKGPKAFPTFVSCLEETGNERIARLLTEPLPSISGAIPPLRSLALPQSRLTNRTWRVKPTVSDFVGRETEVHSLHFQLVHLSQLQNHRLAERPRFHFVWVGGSGGVGKSQLVRRYIAEFGQEAFDGNCVFLDATNRQTLVATLHGFLQEDSSRSGQNRTRSGKDFYQEFAASKLLVVFDNFTKAAWATEYQFEEFLPTAIVGQESEFGVCCIFTSRDTIPPAFLQDAAKWSLVLNPLPVAGCLQYLRSCFSMPQHNDLDPAVDDNLRSLVHDLECHPLSLAKIKGLVQGHSVCDFVNLWNIQRTLMISHLPTEDVDQEYYGGIPWQFTKAFSENMTQLTEENVVGFMRHGLESIRSVYGLEHQKTAQFTKFGVVMLTLFGFVPDALDFAAQLHQLLSGAPGMVGNGGKDRVQWQLRLAELQYQSNQLENALQNYRAVFQWRVAQSEGETRAALSIRSKIAIILLKQGRITEGNSEFEQLDASRVLRFGSTDHERLTDRLAYALVLKQVSQLELAIVVLSDVAASQHQALDVLGEFDTKGEILIIRHDQFMQNQNSQTIHELGKIIQEMTDMIPAVQAVEPNHRWIAKLRKASALINSPFRGLAMLGMTMERTCTVQ